MRNMKPMPGVNLFASSVPGVVRGSLHEGNCITRAQEELSGQAQLPEYVRSSCQDRLA
jgi:hypothetical protein